MLSSLKKELLEIKNDRTLLAIVLIFPIFVTFFMGSSFNKLGINGLPIGVIGKTDSNLTLAVLSGLDNSGAFHTIDFDNLDNATDALKNGQVRAIIELPPDFESSISRGSGANIKITVDNSDLAVEQSILAVLSSVIQASSTNITQSYVGSAWHDLYSLNQSAQSALTRIKEGKLRLNSTYGELVGIEGRLGEIRPDELSASIDGAQLSISRLLERARTQKDEIKRGSQSSADLLLETRLFIDNATVALDQSLDLIDNTSARLERQLVALNNTYTALDATHQSSILLRSQIVNSSCNILTPTVDLLTLSLGTMKNNTLSQISDGHAQLVELRNLNQTLLGFKSNLNSYRSRVNSFNSTSDNATIDGQFASLESEIVSLNSTLNQSKDQVNRISTLLLAMRDTINQSKVTLNDAISGSDAMANLIGQISTIVNVQTSKDPTKIATPITIELKDKYQKQGFADFVFPQVISVTILFSSLLLGAIGLVREKTRNTLMRLALVPNGVLSSVLGKLETCALLSLFQVALILSIGIVFFGVSIPSRLDGIVLGSLVSGLVISTIGILVGLFSKSESSAIQFSLLIAIPMLFLGNVIFSSDLLPKFTQFIQFFVPLSHITNIFKTSMITGGDPYLSILSLFSFEILGMFVLLIVLKYRRLD
ncbi:ABC transporter permease [Candidatus Micrarchaeota archaeon]|nr:ABC transporter permease [Candidatus Micrarchaeota archaeon]